MPFKQQLFVVLTPVILGAALLGNGYQVRLANQTQQDQNACLTATAHEIVQEAAPYYPEMNLLRLQRLAEHAVHTDKLAYIAYYDDQGRFLGAACATPRLQQAFVPRLRNPVSPTSTERVVVSPDDQPSLAVLEVAVPVVLRDQGVDDVALIGSVRVAQAVNARANAVSARFGLIAGFVLLVVGALMIGIFWGRTLMVRALRRVLKPDDTNHQGRHVTQEVGQIAREFQRLNRMVADSREDATQAKALIDKKVTHQTRDLRQQLRKVQRQAHVDPLTGLGSRAWFEQMLPQVFEQAREVQADLACVMIDIDYFKAINDSCGHAAGDELIAFVGELLRANTREGDLNVRQGGDEFILVLWDCRAEEARKVAERIRKHYVREAARFISNGSVLDANPLRYGSSNTAPQWGLSIGVCSLQKDRPNSPQQMLKFADTALYQAKQQGRNAVAMVPSAS